MTADIYHVMPSDEDHPSSPDCACRPVLDDGGVWVHRSFDGRELDEPGHRIRMDSLSAQHVVLFAYYMHWITRSKAMELLVTTPEALEQIMKRFIDSMPPDYKIAEESLRPSQL
jgi:hypothetical protein